MEPFLTDTSIIRTPLYYWQFVRSQICQIKSYIPYLYNTDISVKRTLGSVPLVSVLRRFHCIRITNVDRSSQVFTLFERPPVQKDDTLFKTLDSEIIWTPFNTQDPENHTLFSSTYSYRPKKGAPLPPPRDMAASTWRIASSLSD